MILNIVRKDLYLNQEKTKYGLSETTKLQRKGNTR